MASELPHWRPTDLKDWRRGAAAMTTIQTNYLIGSEADLNNALQQIDIDGALSG